MAPDASTDSMTYLPMERGMFGGPAGGPQRLEVAAPPDETSAGPPHLGQRGDRETRLAVEAIIAVVPAMSCRSWAGYQAVHRPGNSILTNEVSDKVRRGCGFWFPVYGLPLRVRCKSQKVTGGNYL